MLKYSIVNLEKKIKFVDNNIQPYYMEQYNIDQKIQEFIAKIEAKKS